MAAVLVLSFFAVAYASRVRPHAAERDAHADAHSTAFNPALTPMTGFVHVDSARAVAPEIDASKLNLEGGVDVRGKSLQDLESDHKRNDPSLRADWSSTIGDVKTFEEYLYAATHPKASPELLDIFDDWDSAGKPNDESLPIMTRSSLAPVTRRHATRGPAMSGVAVLQRPELERAPPAPPAPPADSGRGGDGGDNSKYLHLVSASVAVGLLDDWIARTRIYSMSDQFGNPDVAKLHRKALEELEAFRAFCESPQENFKIFRKVIFAMVSNDGTKVWALSGGLAMGGSLVEGPSDISAWRGLDGVLEASARGGSLVINDISVNPMQLKKESSTTARQMRLALLQLKKEIHIDQLVMPDAT